MEILERIGTAEKMFARAALVTSAAFFLEKMTILNCSSQKQVQEMTFTVVAIGKFTSAVL